jgi:hypothetical protein
MTGASRKIAVLTAKDLRRIWPIALAVLPPMASFVFNDIQEMVAHVPRAVLIPLQLLYFTLPLAIAILVQSAIHFEPLIGDRQYWLTRPFGWYHLAASKAAAVALCINLPLFLMQAAEFSRHGISPVTYLPDLFLRQVFLTAFYLLPAAAVASLTRTLGQFLLALAIGAVPVLIALGHTRSDARLDPWPWGMSWVLASELAALLAVGSIVVLFLQYSRRRPAVPGTILGAVVLLCIPTVLHPWDWLFGSDRPNPAVRLSLDRSARPAAVRPALPDQFGYRIELPLKIEGLPSDGRLALQRARVMLGNVPIHAAMLLGSIEDGFSLRLLLYAEQYDPSASPAVTLKGRLRLVLFRPAASFRTPREELQIPGFGVCYRSEATCYSPQPHVSLRPSPTVAPEWTFAPVPVSVSFYPLHRYYYQPGYTEDLIASKPTAEWESTFEFDNLRLSEFMVR